MARVPPRALVATALAMPMICACNKRHSKLEPTGWSCFRSQALLTYLDVSGTFLENRCRHFAPCGFRRQLLRIEDFELVDIHVNHELRCSDAYARWAQMQVDSLAREADRLITHWRKVHGTDDRDVLRQILEIVRPHVPPRLITELSKSIVEIAATDARIPPARTDDSRTARLRLRLAELIADQRVTPESFADDGPFNAQRLVNFLEAYGKDLGLSIPDPLRTATLGIADEGTLQLTVASMSRALADLEQSREPKPHSGARR